MRTTLNMKIRISYILAFLVLAFIVASARVKMTEAIYDDRKITFRTSKPAPSKFDAWAFNWTTPFIEEGASLKLVVLKPDTKEYTTLSTGYCPLGQSKRSDFTLNDYNPSVFFTQNISIVFMVSEGRMFFPLPHGFHFTFYEKTKNGVIDYGKPCSTINAVLQGEEVRVIRKASKKRDLHWEAVKLFQRGQYKKAIENLEKAVEEMPKRNWSWYLIGRSHFELGNYQKAFETFSHLISFCPWGPYYYEKVKTLKKLEREDEAALEFKKALQILDSDKGYKLFVYADQMMAGKAPWSKEGIRRILLGGDENGEIRYDPNLHWKAVSLFQKGDYEDCILYSEICVKNTPKRNWSWYLLGRSHFELENYKKAFETFSHLVSFCPWGPYYYEKGKTLKKLEREDEAALEFKKSLADSGF